MRHYRPTWINFPDPAPRRGRLHERLRLWLGRLLGWARPSQAIALARALMRYPF